MMLCIQIIDISANIQLQKLYDERKTLQVVNVTVSHELRNPLNSIKAQNLKMFDLMISLKRKIEHGGITTL
jgi:signal transduction histidine kinase